MSDKLLAAIMAEPGRAVSPAEAAEIAAAVRLTIERQPCSVDHEGKTRGVHWATRCFALAMQVSKLEARRDRR
jgi:hypothetical protein